MSTHPAEVELLQRRLPAGAIIALLLLAGVASWLGWHAYRGELGQILSATPQIEIDLRPAAATAASLAEPLAVSTPKVVVDLTPRPSSSQNPAIPATPPVPVPLSAPATPDAGSSGAAASATPLQSEVVPAASPDAAPTSPAIPPAQALADAVPTAPATAAPTSISPAPAVVASASPPQPPLPAPAPPSPPDSASATQAVPAVPETTTSVAPVETANPLASEPAASPAAAPVSASATPAAPATPETTGPAAPPETANPPASEPATNSPAVAAPAAVAAEPQATDAELLAGLGTPPAPVTKEMVLASVSPPAAAPTTAGAGAGSGSQTVSVIDSFLPQSAPAWQRNARPFDTKDPRPRIAIVITKLGLLHGTTLAAIDQLPADVTLSFSPYANDLPQWIAHAKSLGHEVMLDLPMEASQSGSDPGPDGLLTSLSAEENLQRLNWVIGRAQGYVGLAGVLGDRFTASPVGLRPVLRDIASHGLMFLDPRSSQASVASREATKMRVPRAIADLTIDDTPDRVSIDIQLAELERRARVTGFAVGLANGYPVTIERLAEWSRSLAERNLALAPISAIADQQADR